METCISHNTHRRGVRVGVGGGGGGVTYNFGGKNDVELIRKVKITKGKIPGSRQSKRAIIWSFNMF